MQIKEVCNFYSIQKLFSQTQSIRNANNTDFFKNTSESVVFKSLKRIDLK